MSKRKIDIITIVLFICVITSVMLISIIVPDRDRSELEARELATDINCDSWKQYTSGKLFLSIENYVNDQIIFRDELQGLYTDFQRAMGKFEINNEFILDDGYIVDEMNRVPSYEKFADIIDTVAEKYADENIPFLFVATPTKADVLEYMNKRDYLQISNRRKYTNKYFSLLNEKGVSTLNLLDDIVRLSEEGIPLYYKTDHHWNYKGAYVGYKNIIEYINNSSDLDLTLYEELDFKLHKDNHKFYGSDMRKLGGTLFFNGSYDNVKTLLPKTGKFSLWRYKKGTKEGGSEIFLDYTIFEKDDKYNGYHGINLGGNQKRMILHNYSEEVKGKKILFLGDSFSLQLLPMLSGNFEEIYYFDARKINVDIFKIAKEEQIDYVIFMFNSNMEENRYTNIEKLLKK